jgi:hypothetical protein
MKKTRSEENLKRQALADEILPEYDFRNAARNKYASRYVAGSSVVVLDPDVAAAFPTRREPMTRYELWHQSLRNIGRIDRLAGIPDSASRVKGGLPTSARL